LYIKDVKPGDRISDIFLVAEKSLVYSQKGAPYLNLKLKDRTGEVEGKIWEEAIEWEKKFRKGSLVWIQARALSYRNILQLSIQNLQEVMDNEYDPLDFFPAAVRPAAEMLVDLTKYMEKVTDSDYQALLNAFFNDQTFSHLFQRAPAAKGFHHVCLGGLLEHTLSVVRILDFVTSHYPVINRDLLLTGGILHDIGKIHEYTYDGLIDYSDAGRLIGHIIIGVEMIDSRIVSLKNFPEQKAMELRHILLSHHGALEYGSPKRPKTLEALIVHQVDDLDAKVNAFQEFIRSAQDESSDWTPFHRLLDRFLYKGKGMDPAEEYPTE
jgi:3'-5' exoribonuclease